MKLIIINTILMMQTKVQMIKNMQLVLSNGEYFSQYLLNFTTNQAMLYCEMLEVSNESYRNLAMG